jgi:hypothetical protein
MAFAGWPFPIPRSGIRWPLISPAVIAPIMLAASSFDGVSA